MFGLFPLFDRTQWHAITLSSDAHVGELSQSVWGPSATQHTQELKNSPKGSWGLSPAYLKTHHDILCFLQQCGPRTLLGLESSPLLDLIYYELKLEIVP